MKAVYFTEHGGPGKLIVGDRPDPKLRPGQCRIRVKACALNHLDIWLRMGIPGLTVPFPHILGADVAGYLESGDSELALGTKVLVAPGLSCGQCAPCRNGQDHLCDTYDILGQKSDGGYAELVTVPSANVLPIPDGLSFEEAASLPLVFLTAWHMLVTNGKIAAGETVLIHAGGSGVGIAAIQIARLKKARVITTVGSAEKAEKAAALGAEEIVQYREQDFSKEVMRWTQGRGVDLILDHIGKDTFAKNLDCLAKGGRLLTCGATSGRDVAFDLRTLFGKNISLLGSRMGTRSGLMAALEQVRAGHLHPVIDSIFPLSQAADAHRRMESRSAFGKIVLSL